MRFQEEGRILWAILSEKDALLEEFATQVCLLQALKRKAQVEIESGPHLTQLS